MCLSNVYRKENGQDIFMLKNIANVRVNDGTIVFTDILGIQTELTGVLLNIDLTENIILIKTAEE